jgi:hypothetical protein
LIDLGMIGDVPPLSYTGRAKNLLMNVLSQYLMAKAFLQPIEEVVRPIVRPDFVVEVNKGQNKVPLPRLSNTHIQTSPQPHPN